MGIMSEPADLDALGGSVADAGGVTFVPALAGLAAPYWKPQAKAAFTGMSLATERGAPRARRASKESPPRSRCWRRPPGATSASPLDPAARRRRAHPQRDVAADASRSAASPGRGVPVAARDRARRRRVRRIWAPALDRRHADDWAPRCRRRAADRRRTRPPSAHRRLAARRGSDDGAVIATTPFDVAVVGGGVVGLRGRPPAAASRPRASPCSKPGPTSAPGRARPTRRSCTPGSTPRPARSRRGSSPAATRCCASTRRPSGISIEETGALLVAWDDEQAAGPAGARGQGRRQRVRARRGRRRRDAVYELRATPRPRSDGRDARARRAHHRPVVDAARVRHRGRRQRCDLRTGIRDQRRCDVGDDVTTLVARGRSQSSATRFVVNAAGLHGDELHRALGLDGFTIRPSPRRADRVRQARQAAAVAHDPAGADSAHQGRARRPDRVRQRDARPDRRRHRRQDRHRLDARRHRRPAREGPPDPSGTARRGSDLGVCRSARRDRAQRLPDAADAATSLRVPRRNPIDRASPHRWRWPRKRWRCSPRSGSTCTRAPMAACNRSG